MTSVRHIMTSQKDVKKFLLPYTSSYTLIWAQLEEIAPNPSEWGTFPYNYALFLGGQIWLPSSWLCHKTTERELKWRINAHLVAGHRPFLPHLQTKPIWTKNMQLHFLY